MKTEPLDNPKFGMMAFSKTANLMVEITGARGPNDFTFLVMNGMWEGIVAGGDMLIKAPGGDQTEEFECDFERVTEVSVETFRSYYMNNSRQDNFAITGVEGATPLAGEEIPDPVMDVTKQLAQLHTKEESALLEDISEDDNAQREARIDDLIKQSRQIHGIESPAAEDASDEPGL